MAIGVAPNLNPHRLPCISLLCANFSLIWINHSLIHLLGNLIRKHRIPPVFSSRLEELTPDSTKYPYIFPIKQGIPAEAGSLWPRSPTKTTTYRFPMHFSGLPYANPSFSRRASGVGSFPRKAVYAFSGSIEPPEL